MTNFKHYFFIFTILTISVSLKAQQLSQQVNRKILFSTGPDEKPVFNESSVSISPVGTLVTVLTSDDEGRIYVYENGTKRGPFKDVAGTGVKMQENDPAEYDPIFRRESDADYQKDASYDNDEKITLHFSGKSYGPFQFVLEFYFLNGKRDFSAVVMKEAKPFLVTSSGGSFFLDGQPGYTHVSPGFRKMMVTTIKENNDTGSVLTGNSDVKNEQILSGTTNKNDIKQVIKTPEAFVYFEDGKKFGPYDPKKITSNNPAFSKTGGDNWLLTMDSKLYINGIYAKTLFSDRITPANIWLSEDGKHYAIIVYDRIEFNDGSVYKDPLKIRISIVKNKITVWWLLFENGKDIVLCSRVL